MGSSKLDLLCNGASILGHKIDVVRAGNGHMREACVGRDSTVWMRKCFEKGVSDSLPSSISLFTRVMSFMLLLLLLLLLCLFVCFVLFCFVVVVLLRRKPELSYAL